MNHMDWIGFQREEHGDLRDSAWKSLNSRFRQAMYRSSTISLCLSYINITSMNFALSFPSCISALSIAKKGTKTTSASSAMLALFAKEPFLILKGSSNHPISNTEGGYLKDLGKYAFQTPWSRSLASWESTYA
ncbi:hypothetical protein SAY87_025753 [Trapa incisa]|uniref:Uncharacterized protein n=1 Tax=Trapa incisa TaxID=236973 RepID=A0AAN7GM02_9MYRT|nr:hypothetical protein SAY87_025753 [Trapa incisa]